MRLYHNPLQLACNIKRSTCLAFQEIALFLGFSGLADKAKAPALEAKRMKCGKKSILWKDFGRRVGAECNSFVGEQDLY